MSDNSKNHNDDRHEISFSYELIEPLVRGIIESADTKAEIDDSVLKGIMPLAATIYSTELSKAGTEYDAAFALLFFGFFAGFQAGHFDGHICAEASIVPDTIDQIWPEDDAW
jgi:hypothetical protein